MCGWGYKCTFTWIGTHSQHYPLCILFLYPGMKMRRGLFTTPIAQIINCFILSLNTTGIIYTVYKTHHQVWTLFYLIWLFWSAFMLSVCCGIHFEYTLSHTVIRIVYILIMTIIINKILKNDTVVGLFNQTC